MFHVRHILSILFSLRKEVAVSLLTISQTKKLIAMFYYFVKKIQCFKLFLTLKNITSLQLKFQCLEKERLLCLKNKKKEDTAKDKTRFEIVLPPPRPSWVYPGGACTGRHGEWATRKCQVEDSRDPRTDACCQADSWNAWRSFVPCTSCPPRGLLCDHTMECAVYYVHGISYDHTYLRGKGPV